MNEGDRLSEVAVMPCAVKCSDCADKDKRIEAGLKLVDELESSHLYGYADKLREALGGSDD